MSTIVTRAGKGSPLTHNEVDANFNNLNNGKLETSLTKAQLSTAVSDGDVLFVGDVTTNATHTGDVTGSTALTIDKTAITGKTTVTADAADYVLISDTSDTGNLKKALVSDFGGGGAGDVTAAATFGTDNRLIRSDGTGKGVQASAITISDNGEVTLPSVTTPATPAAGNLNIFAKSVAGDMQPMMAFPDRSATGLQGTLRGQTAINYWRATGESLTDFSTWGMPLTAVGTAFGYSVSAGTKHGRIFWRQWGVTTPSTTAVAGIRVNGNLWTVGGSVAGRGGFRLNMVWSPAFSAANATRRGFAGMRPNTAPTDVNPSSIINMVGMGWDDGDSNVQFMHNDGSGTVTKVDLGASFPRFAADDTTPYELDIYALPGTTSSVSYRVYNMLTGAEATGTVTTDLPANTVFLSPHVQTSVGGTSSTTGFGLHRIYLETSFEP